MLRLVVLFGHLAACKTEDCMFPNPIYKTMLHSSRNCESARVISVMC